MVMQEYVVCRIPCPHKQTDTQEYSPSSPDRYIHNTIQDVWSLTILTPSNPDLYRVWLHRVPLICLVCLKTWAGIQSHIVHRCTRNKQRRRVDSNSFGRHLGPIESRPLISVYRFRGTASDHNSVAFMNASTSCNGGGCDSCVIHRLL